MDEPSARADYWFVVQPAITVVCVAPFAIASLSAPTWFLSWYMAPFWVGVFAAPGYLLAWRAVRQKQAPPGRMRLFATASLVAALAATLAGAVLSAFTLVLGVLSLWSAALTAILLHRFRSLPTQQLHPVAAADEHR